METLWQDLRYSFRMLLKNRSFTIVAVLAIALGIGANSAIFSVVNALLLRPLPYPDPDRLVMVWGDNPKLKLDTDQLPTSAPNFRDWREQSHSFEQLTALRSQPFTFVDTSTPELVNGVCVSASFFPMLGVKPMLGREFTADEDRPGNEKVIVISYGLWQRRYGSDTGIIGKQILINNSNYLVIGVMPAGFNFPRGADLPAGFQFPTQTEIWAPMAFNEADLNRRGRMYLAVMGRLKSNVSMTEAQQDITQVCAHLAEVYPNNKNWGAKLVPLQEQITGKIRPSLLILLAAVGFVLLIACANVANLLLARASFRQKEIAVRMALGASRFRLVRQLLTESILLSLVGGTLGLLLAVWGSDILIALGPDIISRIRAIGIDGRVMGFTFGLSVLTGILFGLIPAWQSTRPDLNDVLKEGGKRGQAGRSSLRGLLVVCEVSLALVLLIGAGLLIRSFLHLQNVAPGFNPNNLVTMTLFLPEAKYPKPEQQAAFFQQAQEKVSKLPGIESVAFVTSLPLSGQVESTGFAIENRPQDPTEHFEGDYHVANPNYFRTMSISLLKGRDFTDQDHADAKHVVIINETMARRYWPDQDAIGQRISFFAKDGQPDWYEIIGIAADVKQTSLSLAIRPEFYWPEAQFPSQAMTLVARTAVKPESMVKPIHETLLSLDKDQPISDVQTMDQIMSQSVAERRFNMLLLGIFAATALLLATIGIYGIISYSVTQRTHEIGIRMALGARPLDVLRLVISQGMKAVLIGVALGLLASFALTRVMSSLLYGVSATDPITFIGISLLLVGIALLASYLPARRATRVDPVIALRYE